MYGYFTNRKAKQLELKHPVIISDNGLKKVMFHQRKYGVSLRGLWYPEDFMTQKPYGKVHNAIGKKVCKLSRRTVGLIDGYKFNNHEYRCMFRDKKELLTVNGVALVSVSKKGY